MRCKNGGFESWCIKNVKRWKNAKFYAESKKKLKVKFFHVFDPQKSKKPWKSYIFLENEVPFSTHYELQVALVSEYCLDPCGRVCRRFATKYWLGQDIKKVEVGGNLVSKVLPGGQDLYTSRLLADFFEEPIFCF